MEIDRKGRVVIPKDVRVQSGISAPGELVVFVEDEGKITLQAADAGLKKAQQVGRRKLRSWSESRHDEDKFAHRLASKEDEQ